MPATDPSDSTLRCYRCGSSLAELSLPLSRLDLCPQCSVELHVCRMCRHFAPARPEQCAEEDAIEVKNKTTANFCDYFVPSATAFGGQELAAEQVARQQLEALFGGTAKDSAASGADSSPTGKALEAAESLFRKPGAD